MAYMKVGQIKKTLSLALTYISQDSKTNTGLVTFHECAPTDGHDVHDVANQFEYLQAVAESERTVGKAGEIKGVHVVQSFAPGEVTAQEAHLIGSEFAAKALGGEHQFVLATHIDQEHIHNHLIFNPVSLVTHQRYRTPKTRLAEWRKISDQICTQHGLKIIEPSDDPELLDPEITLSERYAKARGESTKDHLASVIDEMVSRSDSLQSLVTNLTAVGVEVTFRGRDMLVRDTQTMKRPVRVWRLGPAYSESNLAARLGQTQVTTFTVTPTMVRSGGKNTMRVLIPSMPGHYLSIPKTLMVNHGHAWYLHLPLTQTFAVMTRQGNTFATAMTPEKLSTFFTPVSDLRLATEHGRQPATARGRSDAQRRYFAWIDRQVASASKRMDQVTLRSRLLTMPASQRADWHGSLTAHIAVGHAQLQQLVIERDHTIGELREEIEARIQALSEALREDQKTLAVFQETPEPEKQQTRKKGSRQ